MSIQYSLKNYSLLIKLIIFITTTIHKQELYKIQEELFAYYIKKIWCKNEYTFAIR